jgi:hypothetical protein
VRSYRIDSVVIFIRDIDIDIDIDIDNAHASLHGQGLVVP